MGFGILIIIANSYCVYVYITDMINRIMHGNGMHRRIARPDINQTTNISSLTESIKNIICDLPPFTSMIQ